MIPFFRKIRKNLIKENKTTRYLKYALGEILLVVAGILIAIQTKGYDMIKDFSSKNKIRNDTIFSTITQFYIPYLQIIDDSNEFIKNEVLQNIETYKNHGWFVDWTLGNFTPEMIIYFTESEEYKKQVASHNLLAGKNHLLFVNSYRDNANKLIAYIDKTTQ